MFSTRTTTICAALLAGLWLAPALGDEVVLTNGDRITGRVVGLEGGKLVIKTEYAGKVKVGWSQVSTLSTDEPVYLTIDGNKVRATLSESQPGTARLVSDDWLDADAIELSRLTSVSHEKIPDVKVSGHINAGASSSSGNTEVDKLNMNAEVIARTDKNRFTTGGAVNRAKDKGVETESNWIGYMKYDHFVSKRWYAFANMSGEHDKFKDLRLRTTIGLGSGYQLYDSDVTNLSFEIGANYVNTDYYTALDSDYPAARWAVDFWRKLFGTDAQAFHRHQIFSSLDDSSNLFIRTQTGLRLPVVERLNATIQYNYDYDKNPAPGRRREDKVWLMTVGYWW